MSSKSNRGSWSLAARLTIWYAVASIGLTVVTIGILYWGLVGNLNRSEDLFLADKVHVLRTILRDRPGDIEGLREEVELESAARRYAQFYVRLLGGDGRQRLVTPGMDVLLPPRWFTVATPADMEPSHGNRLFSQQNRSFWGLAAMATVGRPGEKPWSIQVAVDRANDELLLAKYREWLWTVLGVSVLLCPLVGYRIARRGIQPVQEITATAQRTGLTTLDARIEPAGYPVELAALADTFNAMLDRLQDSFRRLSQFSADLAHELRTPINNMRGEAEVALGKARTIEEYREALTSNLEEAVRLSELIGSLLFLARAESPGTHLKTEAVQVLDELRTVRDYYEAAAADAGVTLSLSSVDEIAVGVDRALFRQAIGNLVANAIAHTPAGGRVTVHALKQEGELRIEVSDTGVGIPADDLPRVFDRFYRVDKSRSSRGGVGLGLAIVKGIAGLHGGRTEIHSEMGRGTRVAVLFPIGQPSGTDQASGALASK
jgi:two-component system, OmpR family, heavy metal sensor histidine kinase CusS